MFLKSTKAKNLLSFDQKHKLKVKIKASWVAPKPSFALVETLAGVGCSFPEPQATTGAAFPVICRLHLIK